MAWIRYPVTNFVEPPPLMAHEYDKIKDQFKLDPNIDVFPKAEGYFEHFKKEFIGIIGGLVGGFVSFNIGLVFEGRWIARIFFLIGVTLAFGVGFLGIYMHLIMGAPKFALYRRKRKKYFKVMKEEIQKSNYYSEFASSFYSK